MAKLLAMLIGAVLVNHYVFVRFPAICPWGVPAGRNGLPPGAPLATALVVTSALTTAVAFAWLVDSSLLRVLDLRELRLPVLTLAITVTVPSAALAIRFASPIRHATLEPYVPLVLCNCVMLGAALLVTVQAATLAAALASAAATSIAFSLLLGMFGELRERLEAADVPAPLQGAAIALVTAGMMSLAFSGIASVVRG